MKIGRVVGLQADDVITSASAGLGIGASQLTKSDIEDMRAICEVVNEMGGIAGSGEFLEGSSSAEVRAPRRARGGAMHQREFLWCERLPFLPGARS